MASATLRNRRPAMRQPMAYPIAPPSSVPKMATPPSQMKRILTRSLPGPK